MTQRQTALLLAFALLAGACTATRPTTAPVASAMPSPSPAATLVPTPTLTPTPPPPATCPPDPSSIQASLEIRTPTGVEAVDLAAGPLESPVAIDPSEVTIVATLLGGVDVSVVVRLSEGPDDVAVITELAADFLPFGTGTTVPVAATLNGSAASLRLPARDLAGQLRLSASWATSCGSWDGAGTIGTSVVPSSVAAGCPTTVAGLEADFTSLVGKHVTVGTTSVPLIVTAWSGRWTLATGAADIAEFAGWDRTTGAIASPGASIVLSEAIMDLHLVSIRASTFLRADVVAYLEPDSTDELGTVAVVRRPANAKGRAGIPVPLEPDRYVVEIEGVWLTSCLSLETYAAVSVDVK